MSTNVNFPTFLNQINVLTNSMKDELYSDSAFSESDISHQTHVLLEKASIDSDTLNYYLAEWQKLASANLNQINADCIKELPEKPCRRFHVIPFQWEDGTLCLATTNPFDDALLSTLNQLLHCPYTLFLSTPELINDALGRHFRKTDSIHRLARRAKGVALKDKLSVSDHGQARDFDNKASVVNLVDDILQDALQCQATDIHIESNFEHLIYYYRVGHESSEVFTLPQEIADMLVQRLIVLGDGDIAQRRLPQDLSFSFKRQGRKNPINVRISVLFTLTGYSIVMRLLLSEADTIPLESLLLDKKIYQTVTDFLHSEHGMMIVAGPTASGKTTLLYSLLKRIQDGHKKIISIEDPVEIQFSYLNQVQVNPDIGLDFADVIRSSVRQNPDVLMIGEARDEVTASMAMRSAITGALVFTTLHTPSATKTVLRLVDLGVEPFLIGSALRLILATRLLRRVCQNCAQEPRLLNDEEKRRLSNQIKNLDAFSVVEGAGCDVCHQTGNHGLILITENLKLTSSMQDVISRGDFESFEQQAKEALMGDRLQDQAQALVEKRVIPVNELVKLVSDL